MNKNPFQLILASLCLLIPALANTYAHATPASSLKNFIKHLEVSEPIYHDNLTIIPVYRSQKNTYKSFTSLDEALNNNWIEITELNGGNVPKVKISNHSNRKIFIMGGEILSGGKQDRIVGRDVLLNANSRNIIVPVYCTEEGRWNQQSKKFYSKNNLGTWQMRSTAQHAPAQAQSEIWGNISSVSKKTGVSSRTNAYQEVYEDRQVQNRIAEHEIYLQNIPDLYPDTIGVVIGVGNRIISVDLFDTPRLFQKLWPKILKASSFATVSDDYYSGSITEKDAINILRNIHDTSYKNKPAIDLGQEISFFNKNINTNALLFKQKVVHLSAFPKMKQKMLFKGNRQTNRRIPVMRR